MALSSILEIVTRTCDELGLGRPGTAGAVGSSDPQERQMVALLNATGLDLVMAHDWSPLIATASIEISSAGGSSYSLPTDFERVLDNSGWDRTNMFPLAGSITPQRHQFWLSSSVVAPTTRKEFRLFIGNTSTVYVHPVPTATETISFLYVKSNWKTNSLGSSANSFIETDDDLTVFSPKLLVKELKWRFRAAKGLDATALKMECDVLRDQLIARDVASGAVDMAGPVEVAPIDYLNIPDGNWSLS